MGWDGLVLSGVWILWKGCMGDSMHWTGVWGKGASVYKKSIWGGGGGGQGCIKVEYSLEVVRRALPCCGHNI